MSEANLKNKQKQENYSEKKPLSLYTEFHLQLQEVLQLHISLFLNQYDNIWDLKQSLGKTGSFPVY